MSMRRVNNLSASPGDYIEWLCKERLLLEKDEMQTYFKLFDCMLNIDFCSGHPNDVRRENEGLNLREDFEYETGLYLEGLSPRCSFLEMLVALAYRCERQLMRSSYYGDRTSKWFFDMVHSLGLGKFTSSNWSSRSKENVIRICEDAMDRKISLFDYRNANENINEEIWKQLCCYINEKYVDNSEYAI